MHHDALLYPPQSNSLGKNMQYPIELRGVMSTNVRLSRDFKNGQGLRTLEDIVGH
jgi:hypothetical protein